MSRVARFLIIRELLQTPRALRISSVMVENVIQLVGNLKATINASSASAASAFSPGATAMGVGVAGMCGSLQLSV